MIDLLYWNIWAQVTLAALCVALIAGVADRMRARRRRIDAVGFMPWSAITALSLMVALFAAALTVVQG